MVMTHVKGYTEDLCGTLLFITWKLLGMDIYDTNDSFDRVLINM
jgi:hypothetical protein